MNYVIHFIDGDHAVHVPMLVQDATWLPRNGDLLCIGEEAGRSYTRWIVHSVAHNVMMDNSPARRVAAPPNVFVRTAPPKVCDL